MKDGWSKVEWTGIKRASLTSRGCSFQTAYTRGILKQKHSEGRGCSSMVKHLLWHKTGEICFVGEGFCLQLRVSSCLSYVWAICTRCVWSHEVGDVGRKCIGMYACPLGCRQEVWRQEISQDVCLLLTGHGTRYWGMWLVGFTFFRPWQTWPVVIFWEPRDGSGWSTSCLANI